MNEAARLLPARRSRARLTLVGLFALFFLPIAIAFWLNVSHPHWLPFGQRNVGELVTPPLGLDFAALRPAPTDLGGAPAAAGSWTLLVAVAPPCEERCADLLLATRQARLALGKDMGRVHRVLVSARARPVNLAGALLDAHPDLGQAVADPAWLAQLPGGAPAGGLSLFLVDPQGYLILRYGPETGGDGLLKDLKRLLRISKIG